MEYINLFIKGIVIGIGKIIPGVSGSMLAISLGIYERIIYSISNLFKNFKENSKFLINVGLGIVIAIILISKIIVFSLNHWYFPVMMLFIGLIIGGLSSIFKVVKERLCFKYIIILSIPFLFFHLLDILENNVSIKIEFTYINCFLLGIIETFTMIIPGISGTAIMMMLGIYEEQLMMFSDFNYFLYLIMFMLGILLSTFLISNIIIKILNRYRTGSYYLIIGFSISSILALLKITLSTSFNKNDLLIGIVLLIIGVFVSYKLE